LAAPLTCRRCKWASRRCCASASVGFETGKCGAAYSSPVRRVARLAVLSTLFARAAAVRSGGGESSLHPMHPERTAAARASDEIDIEAIAEILKAASILNGFKTAGAWPPRKRWHLEASPELAPPPMQKRVRLEEPTTVTIRQTTEARVFSPYRVLPEKFGKTGAHAAEPGSGQPCFALRNMPVMKQDVLSNIRAFLSAGEAVYLAAPPVIDGGWEIVGLAEGGVTLWDALTCETGKSELRTVELFAPGGHEATSRQWVGRGACQSLLRWLFAVSSESLLRHRKELLREARLRLPDDDDAPCRDALTKVAQCGTTEMCGRMRELIAVAGNMYAT